MAQTLTYRQLGPAARDQAHTLFAQTMGYVAVTAALFALGAWLGRNLTGGVGIVACIAAFAALIGMRFVSGASKVTDGMLRAAAEAVAGQADVGAPGAQDAIWQPAYPDSVS